jgi:hypothetical protein
LPIRHLLQQVRHVDAVDAERAEIGTHHPVRLGHGISDRAAIVEGLPRRDQHAIAAGGWRDRRGHMKIAERGQRDTQTLTGLAAAIFGDDENIRLVLSDCGGDPRQACAAALADVPGQEAQGHLSAFNRPRRGARRGR